MAIGKRINFFRKRKGLTQKKLGEALGFKKESADIRIVQYEKEDRIPREDVILKMAEVLGVSPKAIKVPDIDDEVGVMHTLFTLEDFYGFQIKECDIGPYIGLNVESSKVPDELKGFFKEWLIKRMQFENGEISKEEYDEWRYRFSKNVSFY